MKKLFGLLCCFCIACCVQAQLDTLTFVPHASRSECKDGDCKYWVDEKQVTKVKYQAALDESYTMGKCKPCWLKQRYKGSGLVEGYFFTDCCIGAYIEYYDDGTIKLKGQYKTPKNPSDPNLYDDGYCRREGVWKYYKRDGTVEKTETYKDGNIVPDK